MRVTEVAVSFSYTKNLGNYQSLKAEASATAELESGEETTEVFDRLFKLVKNEVRKQVREEREQM